MRTPTTFGIEYTFVPKTDVPPYEMDDRVENVVNHLRNAGIDSAHNDGGALEVPSPVHRSVTGAKRFYERLIKQVRPRRLVAQRVDIDDEGNECYYGTGGGHIHLGLFNRRATSDEGARQLTQRDYLLVRNIAVLVYNRPWLGWVFNEFMDDWNAKAITSKKWLGQLLAKDSVSKLPPAEQVYRYSAIGTSYVPGNRFKPAFKKIRGALGKDTAICLGTPSETNQWTMEFRFFDAPRSWPQVQEHLDFAMALFRYARKAANRGQWLEVGEMGMPAVKAFRNRDKVERAFRSTCRMLGLEWSRYSKYMENYDLREENGKLT